MPEIIAERLARLMSDDVHLRNGSGNGANGTVDVCAVQAADWLSGGNGKTDKPDCVSRKIGSYVIGLNDSLLFKEHRDLLKPYCAKLVGTAGESGEREVKRAYCLADWAIRVFAPIWLRADPKHRFDERAAKLESLAPITDEETRKKARAEARAAAAAAAAAYAADAAYAAYAADAAYAAYAAYAASAAYAAYAADSASAADAADAADAASAAYAAKVREQYGDLLRQKALEALDAVLAI